VEGDIFKPPESDKEVNPTKDDVLVLHRPPHLGRHQGVHERLHVGGHLVVGGLGGRLGAVHRAVVVHREIVVNLGVALGHEGDTRCHLLEAPGDLALFPSPRFGGARDRTLCLHLDLVSSDC